MKLFKIPINLSFPVLCFFAVTANLILPTQGHSKANEQRARISVSVMPFHSSVNDTYTNLTSQAVRDSLIQKLVQDPELLVVTRRRAYTLSLDSEIIISDPRSAYYKTPADYVIFGHLIPAETTEQFKVDMVVAIFEARSGELILLEKIPGGSDVPSLLAEKFHEKVYEGILKASSGRQAIRHLGGYKLIPEKLVILPVWALGFDDSEFDNSIKEVVRAIENGLRTVWPDSSVVSTEQVMEILKSHGLNKIGDRADAYAENVAEVLKADHVLVVKLTGVELEDGAIQWISCLLSIDVKTGIISQAHEVIFNSFEELLQRAHLLGEDFASQPYEVPMGFNSKAESQRRLSQEGNIYRNLALERDWVTRSLTDVSISTELRIEMAETALSTLQGLTDEAFIELLENSYKLAYKLPAGLDVYGDYSQELPDSYILNSNADFMHLALNSRKWRNQDNFIAGEQLRIQNLILMGQAEEALTYLDQFPRESLVYPLLLGQIQMLQGNYREALNTFETIESQELDYYELKAKATHKIGDFKQEYDALKAYLKQRKSISHWRTGQRTVYLMNFHESPEDRIELIEQYLIKDNWARGTDVAQYTIARAQLELGQTFPALSVLRSLEQKERFTGILRKYEESVRSEIKKLLKPYIDEAIQNVSYVDVRPAPSNLRYYVQPIGYTDTEALQVALAKAESFSGIDFILLPTLRAPLNELIYNVETRRYIAPNLHRWLVGNIERPDDALHYCFVLDQDICSMKGGWIYSSKYPHGWTVISDYRWRKYYDHYSSQQIGLALAKKWLSCLQYPMQRMLGKEKINEITGSPHWPNHSGTIQYSKGTAAEVFEAPFSICETTRKLYAQIEWKALMDFQSKKLESYKERLKESIDLISRNIESPRFLEKPGTEQ